MDFLVEGLTYKLKFLEWKDLLEEPQYKNNEDTLNEIRQVFGENGEGYGGLTDPINTMIYVNPNMPEEKTKKIIIHEFVEALNSECLLELSHIAIQSVTNALYNSKRFKLDDLKNEKQSNTFD